MDMRISNVYSVYNAQPSRSASYNARVDIGRANYADSVSLSAQAGEFQFAHRAVQSAPDIREGLVSDIKEKIAAGTYEINAEAIASKIFQGLE